jgi:hypothetical protein
MVDGKALIGMNETKLGFPVPFWLIEQMGKTIGFRKAGNLLGKCEEYLLLFF